MKVHTAVVILSIAAAAGCSARHEAEKPQAQPLHVRVATAAIEQVPEEFAAGGVVRAGDTAALSSRIMAPVERVLVKAGDTVRAGQPLVTLDARQLDADVLRASAALEAGRQAGAVAAADRDAASAAAVLATRYHDRIATLASTGSATRQELDEAVAGRDSAAARATAAAARIQEAQRSVAASEESLRAAKVARSYAVLAAPFDGVVVSRSVDPGMLASPGVPLLTVETTRRYRLEVLLDEARAAGLASGAHVPVSIEGIGNVDGTVTELERTIDRTARVTRVKIALPDDSRLRSGAFGRALVPGTARPLVTVPSSSIVRNGQLTLVFVAVDGVARLRAVREAAGRGDRTPIIAGLEAGERVVVAPPPGLEDGRPVSVEDVR